MVILENHREYKHILLKQMKEFNDVQKFYEENDKKCTEGHKNPNRELY